MQLIVDEKTPVIIVSKMSLVHTPASIQENLPTDAPVVESIDEKSADNSQDLSHKEQKDEKPSIESSEDTNNDEERCVETIDDDLKLESNGEERKELVDNASIAKNDQETSFDVVKDGSPKQQTEEENSDSIDNSNQYVSHKEQNDKVCIDNTDNISSIIKINQNSSHNTDEDVSTKGLIVNNIINYPKENSDEKLKINTCEIVSTNLEEKGSIEKQAESNDHDDELVIEMKEKNLDNASLNNLGNTTFSGSENTQYSAKFTDNPNKDNSEIDILEENTTLAPNMDINIRRDSSFAKVDYIIDKEEIAKTNGIESAENDEHSTTLGINIENSCMEQNAPNKDNNNADDESDDNVEKREENSSMEQGVMNKDNNNINDEDAYNLDSIENVHSSASEEYSTNHNNHSNDMKKIEGANNDHNELSTDMEIDNIENSKVIDKCVDNKSDSIELGHTKIDCSAGFNDNDSSSSSHEDITQAEEQDFIMLSEASKESVSNNVEREEDMIITNETKVQESNDSDVFAIDEAMELAKTVETSESIKKDTDKDVASNEHVILARDEELKLSKTVKASESNKRDSDIGVASNEPAILATDETMELANTVESSESNKRDADKVVESNEPVILVTDQAMELDITIEVSESNKKDADKEIDDKPTVVGDEKLINEATDKEDEKIKNATKYCTEKVFEKLIENKIQKKSMLANNLELFSDEEDLTLPLEKNASESMQSDSIKSGTNRECVSLVDDDDDIMVIDDDTSLKNEKESSKIKELQETKKLIKPTQESQNSGSNSDILSDANEKADSKGVTTQVESTKPENADTSTTEAHKKPDNKPLVANDFLNNFKTKMSEMTRSDLEEFCVLKIVEGVIDRSNLSEIKAKLKTMMQNVEDWRKKAMVLNKQNRDLQIVMRTIQEEQKKKSEEAITPLKITRSVGMQVLMTDNKSDTVRPRNQKRFSPAMAPPQRNTNQKQSTKILKTPIPVPRLVPAVSPTKPAAKPSPQVQNSTVTSNSVLVKSTVLNGMRPTTPIKAAEKRSFSDAIDLTDDEPAPPMKKPPPVRLVPPQQLMAPGRCAMTINTKNSAVQHNSPRQVYIPIGSQNNIKPGQTLVFKSALQPNRLRAPSNPGAVIRGGSPNVRPAVRSQNKHPAPLPQAYSQPQPPNWKALPPAPDLKISKIENGIVVSWKIDGYQESSYEEIVSYQLYAYQETSAPASTFLWNKIGDIKALPLPMACTLTQFIAGYKYYFAVRAVDIKSRIGPFSLPGSILLLNK